MTGSDTIYAVSSGVGKAGIAVVRVSGLASAELLSGLAGGLPEARRASLRTLRNPATGEILDRGVVIWMPGPGSSTGEDVAEFHVHGSQAVSAGLFDAFNSIGGVRPAEPGEFTRRAFSNGRIDLVEAEGLVDLLSARSARQRKQAVHHMMGRASLVYEEWRGGLLAVLAHVEAAVDFADDEGVAEAAMLQVKNDIAGLVSSMTAALKDASRAAEIRSGIKIVLAGQPNTGKSSLLNALARRDAAIVSSRPGTTRDVIEVAVEIEGLVATLTDTAGLREGSTDEIEQIGMGRTRREVDDADLTLWVCSPDIEGSHTVAEGVSPSLRILNKCDLLADGSETWPEESGDTLHLSAATGDGMAELIQRLSRLIRERYDHANEAVIVRSRQAQAVEESIRHLNDSLSHDLSQLELVAEDLRRAAWAMGRITGRIDVEDLLSAIFSEFCIGK